MSRPVWIQKLDDALSHIESWLIGGLAVMAFVIGSLQVILRYVFNTGFSWSEGIFVLLTIAAMLAAGSRAVREDAHVRMDLLAQKSPPAIKKALTLASILVTFALCLYFCIAGYTYVVFSYEMETISPETGIEEWQSWSIIPLSMMAFSLRYFILFLDVWNDRPIVHKKVRE
jgi:C4-dicarboxylate transporter, DctQ subunit